jgi:hypothetical protein
LQPGGYVDAVADHGVIIAVRRAHISRQCGAGGDPDPYTQDKYFVERRVDLLHRFLNLKCRIDGTEHVVVVLDGDIEKGHDPIAQQAIHDAMLLSNGRGTPFEKLFSHRSELFDPKLLGQASIFPKIGEEYRYLRETARLPV